MDRERICHGKSVFKGPETCGSDFAAEQPETAALSGSQGRQVAIKISGSPAAGHIPERRHFPRSKRFRRSARPRDRLAAIDYETSFGSGDSQRAKRVVDWLEIERCTRSARSHAADRIQGSYRLRQLGTTTPTVSLETYQTTVPGNAPRASRSRFLLRLMLENEEGQRAPPPASDHPLRPRGYI
jgi:hypothetical protein